MKIFVGWDGIDITAYEVLKKSILANTKEDIEFIPIKEHECRWRGMYWRSYATDGGGQKTDDRDGKPFSTGFTFTRFLVPMLNDFKDEVVLFIDPDMMFKADVADLFALFDNTKAVCCVKHDHQPPEGKKMGGFIQNHYMRKNWSSLMLMNTSRCRNLFPYNVNNKSGSWLHGLLWLQDEEIGGLPEEWNWLDGWSSLSIVPKNIHFTRGTPDMPDCGDVSYMKEWWKYARKD